MPSISVIGSGDMGTALDDVLGTFKSPGARSELSQLMHDLVYNGVEAGFGDEQLTALVLFLETHGN